MPWYVYVGLAGATCGIWGSLLGRAFAAVVYGFGTWGSWMAEEEPGEFGPYVPRWRQHSTPSYTELVRKYRALAKEASDEAARADEAGLDGELWRALAATWTEVAESALSRRFSEECTCPDHRAARAKQVAFK